MKRFLVVDTSSVIRKIVKRILAKEGVMTFEAEAGEHMLELCSYEMPECIIVSTSLDDMDIETAVRRIRGMKGGERPKIVISLVDLNVGRIMRAKRAGADGYLLKPFDRASLLAALSVAFEQGAKAAEAAKPAESASDATAAA